MEDPIEYNARRPVPEIDEVSLDEVMKWYPWASPDEAREIYCLKLYLCDLRGVPFWDEYDQSLSEECRKEIAKSIFMVAGKSYLMKMRERRMSGGKQLSINDQKQ